MTERGILFSPEMVIQLLADFKNETRRIMKPQPETWHTVKRAPFDSEEHPLIWSPLADHSEDHKCPYGAAGSRLYVREAWRTLAMWDSLRPCGIPNLGRIPIKYEADGAINGPTEYPYGRYRHARFMPRELARIHLELIEVGAEKLQEITEEGAIAEGSKPWPFNALQHMTSGELGSDSPYRGGYAVLWDDINEDVTWKSNPWVWKLRFKRLPK